MVGKANLRTCSNLDKPDIKINARCATVSGQHMLLTIKIMPIVMSSDQYL